MGSSLMLQIVNGKGKKGKREENKKRKEPSPYLSKPCWNGLSKYTAESQWKNDTSGPGFEWHGGFGQDPLQTEIYFPPLWMCRGGATARGRTGNGRRVMANIFWMGSAARFPGSELVTRAGVNV